MKNDNTTSTIPIPGETICVGIFSGSGKSNEANPMLGFCVNAI